VTKAALTRTVAILLVLAGLPTGTFQHLGAAHPLYFGAPDQGSIILIEARKPVARDQASVDSPEALADGGEPPAATPAREAAAAPVAEAAPERRRAPRRMASARVLLPHSTGPPAG